MHACVCTQVMDTANDLATLWRELNRDFAGGARAIVDARVSTASSSSSSASSSSSSSSSSGGGAPTFSSVPSDPRRARFAAAVCLFLEAFTEQSKEKKFAVGNMVHVALSLMTKEGGVTVLLDCLIAALERNCGYITPYIPSPNSTAFKSELELKLAVGYKVSAEDGILESDKEFLERCENSIQLLAATLQVRIPNFSHSRFINLAWVWLARMLNAPKPFVGCATALQAFLSTAGYELGRCFPKQVVKLMAFVRDTYLPRLVHGAARNSSSNSNAGAGGGGVALTAPSKIAEEDPAIASLKQLVAVFFARGGSFDVPDGQQLAMGQDVVSTIARVTGDDFHSSQ